MGIGWREERLKKVVRKVFRRYLRQYDVEVRKMVHDEITCLKYFLVEGIQVRNLFSHD